MKSVAYSSRLCQALVQLAIKEAKDYVRVHLGLYGANEQECEDHARILEEQISEVLTEYIADQSRRIGRGETV